MTCHGFDQHKPVLRRVMNDHIGHLAMFLDLHAQSSEGVRIKVRPFLFRIADIYDSAPGREQRAEIIEYLLDENVLAARRQLNPGPVLKRHRNPRRLPFTRIEAFESINRRQILCQPRRPLKRPECAEQLQCGGLDLVDGFRTVRRSRRLVRIRNRQAGLHKLMNGVPPHGFAGVRSISPAVVIGEELHHWGDTHQRGTRICPGFVWLRSRSDRRVRADRSFSCCRGNPNSSRTSMAS